MLTTEHISHGNYAIKALTGLVVFGSTENRAQPDKQFADGGLTLSQQGPLNVERARSTDVSFISSVQ